MQTLTINYKYTRQKSGSLYPDTTVIFFMRFPIDFVDYPNQFVQ